MRLSENVTFRSNCRDDTVVGMFSNLEKYVAIYQYLLKDQLWLNRSEYRVGTTSYRLNGGKRNKEAHAQSTLDFTKQCD